MSVFWRVRIDLPSIVCWAPSGDSTQHAAVLGFDEDAAGDGFLLAVVGEGDAFDGLGVGGGAAFRVIVARRRCWRVRGWAWLRQQAGRSVSDRWPSNVLQCELTVRQWNAAERAYALLTLVLYSCGDAASVRRGVATIGLVHALAGDGAGVGGEQEHFVAAGAGGGDHAFAEAEFHLAAGRGWRRRSTSRPTRSCRLVGFLDAGEDGPGRCRRRG